MRIAYNQNPLLQEWNTAHTDADFIETLRQADEGAAYKLILAVYDRLDERVDSVNTKDRYIKDHGKLFEFLTQPSNPLDYNPIPDVQSRFNWTRKQVDVLERPSPDADDVKKLWQAAESLEEKMLLVAAFAWGLRAGEIASLHISNLNLEPDIDGDLNGPVVRFDVRKNQPNPVNIIYGRQIARERIGQLKEKHGNGWSGYLFTSSDVRSEHLDPSTLLTRRFQPVAQRAGVTIDGSDPTLKQSRRWWYQKYWKGQQRLLEILSLTAEEQGSADPEVVLTNYLGDMSRLEFSRLWMRSRLGKAFDDLSVHREPIFRSNSEPKKAKEQLLDMVDIIEQAI